MDQIRARLRYHRNIIATQIAAIPKNELVSCDETDGNLRGVVRAHYGYAERILDEVWKTIAIMIAQREVRESSRSQTG